MSSRTEEMLTAIAEGSAIDTEPICRREQYLKAIANGDATNLPEPICREEELLLQIAENGTGGGSTTIVTEDITITPTTSVQTKTRSAGKYINKVTVNAIQTEEKTVTENGEVTPTSGNFLSKVTVNVPETEPILQEKTATANGDVTPDEGYDGLSKVVVNVASSGGGTDRLQWKIDNMKSLKYEYDHYSGENLDEALVGLDTSQVTNMDYIFYYCSNLKSVPLINTANVTQMNYAFSYCGEITTVPLFDISNCTNAEHLFNYCTKLEQVPLLDTSKITSFFYMFGNCTNLKTIPQLDTSNGQRFPNMFDSCENLLEVPALETKNGTYMQQMFRSCTNLKTVNGIDLLNATNVTNIFSWCVNLTNINVKNIKIALQIGSSNSFGHKLTLDSLLNTIKELWNMSSSSSKTLTVGSANLSKLASVYVKLVDITDEMRAEDEYIDNKLPFEVCESTDEGAMLITDYASTLKNWEIK